MFPEDLLTACDYLRMALAQMMTRRIPPTPHQYALWYAHVRGRDPAVSAALLDGTSADDLRDPGHAADLFHAHFDATDDSAARYAAIASADLACAHSLLWSLAERLGADDAVTAELVEPLRVLEAAIGQTQVAPARDPLAERQMLERVLAQALARSSDATNKTCLLLLHGCPDIERLQHIAERFVDEATVDIYFDHHGRDGVACVIGAGLGVVRPLAARFSEEIARQGGCLVLLDAAPQESPTDLRTRAETALIQTRLRRQVAAEFSAEMVSGADRSGSQTPGPDRPRQTDC